MKINVYTTHDKLSAMTEATSELVIWRNGRLATLNPDHAQPYGLLERHALLVRDGRIAAIVAEDDVPSGRSIDLEGRLLTPGFNRLPHPSRSSAAAGPRSGSSG